MTSFSDLFTLPIMYIRLSVSPYRYICLSLMYLSTTYILGFARYINISISIYLSIHLSIYPSICIYLSIHLHLSICPSVSIYLSIHLSIYLFLSLF